jgi:membrane protein DedA with SNARE-associated domain
LITVLLSLTIPIVPFALIGELPGERWLSAAGTDGLVFGISGAALLAADVLLPVPSSIVGTLLGARLGFPAGWLCGWIGLCLGNFAGYGAGRLLSLRHSSGLPSAPTLLLCFASRPVPILAEALTLTAGASRTPLGPFLVATVAGNALYMAALAGSGAALLPGAAAGPGLALPMLLPAVAWLLWRLAGRRHASPPTSKIQERTECST